MEKKEKPSVLEQEHLEYLDELRESGVTNMFGASVYLEREFPELNTKEAKDILVHWMATFEERHPDPAT